jgi:hypothetical protein
VAGPLFVECKARRLPVATVYEKPARALRARKRTMPAVVGKATTRGPMLVSLKLHDFARLLRGGLTQRVSWRP